MTWMATGETRCGSGARVYATHASRPNRSRCCGRMSGVEFALFIFCTLLRTSAGMEVEIAEQGLPDARTFGQVGHPPRFDGTGNFSKWACAAKAYFVMLGVFTHDQFVQMEEWQDMLNLDDVSETFRRRASILSGFYRVSCLLVQLSESFNGLNKATGSKAGDNWWGVLNSGVNDGGLASSYHGL